MPTTTIELTEIQKDELDARKQYEGESYKSVVGRLLEADHATDDEIAAAVARELDYTHLADLVAERVVAQMEATMR